MESGEKENDQSTILKEDQNAIIPPRQPLQDVINCTQPAGPTSTEAKCKIPIPCKAVKPSKLPGPKMVVKGPKKMFSRRPQAPVQSAFSCEEIKKKKMEDGELKVAPQPVEVPKEDIKPPTHSNLMNNPSKDVAQTDLSCIETKKCRTKPEELKLDLPPVQVTTKEVQPTKEFNLPIHPIKEPTTSDQSSPETKQPEELQVVKVHSEVPITEIRPPNDCNLPINQSTDRLRAVNPVPVDLKSSESGVEIRPMRQPCSTAPSGCNCSEAGSQSGKMLIDTAEYETLKNDVKITKRTILLLERLNEGTSEELLEASGQVGGLVSQIQQLKQENDGLRGEIEALHQALSMCEKEQVDRETATLTLREMEEKLQKEIHSLEALITNQEETIRQQKEAIKQKEKTICHQKDTIGQQTKSLEYRANEIEEKVTVIEKLSIQIENLESVKESMEFLDTEHRALLEEHGTLIDNSKSLVQQLEATESSLKVCQETLFEKSSNLKTLESEVKYLQKENQTLRTEMEAVISVSKPVLSSQKGDMIKYGGLVKKFSQKLTGLLRTLLFTAGMRVSPNLIQSFGDKSDQPWVHSLVSSVLQAVTGDINQTKGDHSSCVPKGDHSMSPDRDESSTKGDQSMSYGDNSSTKGDQSLTPDGNESSTKGDQSLTPDGNESSTKGDDSVNISGVTRLSGNEFSNDNRLTPEIFNTELRDNLDSPALVKHNVSDIAGNSVETRVKELLGLSNQSSYQPPPGLSTEMQHLSLILEEITRIFHVLEEAAFLSIQDLRRENDLKTDEVSQMWKNINSTDKELECLKEQLDKERCMVNQLTSEKDVLVTQQEDLLTKLEDNVAESAPVDSLAAVESRFYKETLHLQKNIYILKEQLSEKNKQIDQLNEKATRRMKVLQENCLKADREVSGLDKIIENARRVLHRNRDVFTSCDPLIKLLKELDGKVLNGEDPTLKLLEPVKTTMW